jgi:hypothetical protein
LHQTGRGFSLSWSLEALVIKTISMRHQKDTGRPKIAVLSKPLDIQTCLISKELRSKTRNDGTVDAKDGKTDPAYFPVAPHERNIV